MAEIEFIEGLFVKAPHPNAPDFVKATLSITRADLGNWLRGRSEQHINIDVKESKGGKWYASVSTFEPDKSKAQPARDAAQEPHGSSPQAIDDYNDDIPF